MDRPVFNGRDGCDGAEVVAAPDNVLMAGLKAFLDANADASDVRTGLMDQRLRAFERFAVGSSSLQPS